MPEPDLLVGGTDGPRRRRAGAGAAVVLLAAAVGVAVGAGLRGGTPAPPAPLTPSPSPRSSTPPAVIPPPPLDVALDGTVQDPRQRTVAIVFAVFNDGDRPVVVERVGADTRALRLLSTTWVRRGGESRHRRVEPPVVIRPGSVHRVTVRYRLRACPADGVGALLVPAVVTTHEHGRQTVDLAARLGATSWTHGLLSSLCPAG